MPERALVGWKQISQFMCWSENKIRAKREELQNAGVIFYTYMGCPPTKKVQAFPSVLIAWTIKKSQNRELL
jgi:hypothetical protein